MTPPATPTQQQNNFSEGFALGLVLRGRWSVPFKKRDVDMAVVHAFSSWVHASHFPKVASDLRGYRGARALMRVGENKQAKLFYWKADTHLRIVRRDAVWEEASPNDVDDAVCAFGGLVPREGWEDLASAFLLELEL